MSQTLLEMTKELVAEQILRRQVVPEHAQCVLKSTFDTLQSLQQAEVSRAEASTGAPLPVPDAPEAPPLADWEKSITKHAIICLECGNSFRQLSSRHLRIHDLDPRAYRAKYGIPKTQNLSARAATARRRELAQQIRPWERANAKGRPPKGGAKH